MSNVFEQIANARSMGGARFTPIENYTGEHVLAVVNFYAFKTRDHGPALCMEGLVLQTTGNAPVGQMVSKSFFIARAKFPEYEQADAKGFMSALLSSADPAFIASEGEKLTSNPAGQGGRGVLVTAACTSRQDKKNTARSFTDVKWAPVDGNTPERIRQLRAEVEQRVPATALTLPDTTCVLSAAPVQPVQTQAWNPAPAPAAPVNLAGPASGAPVAWSPQPVQPAAPQPAAAPSLLGQFGIK